MTPRERRLRLLAKIIPLVASLLIGVLALELYARWLYSRPSMHFGLEMWKYAKTLKIRAENAEMAHRHRPNSEAFLMGVDVKINSLGLRNREILLRILPFLSCRNPTLVEPLSAFLIRFRIL